MNRNSKLATIIGLFVVLLFLFIFYYISINVISYFKEVKPETVLTIFATMFTIFISLFGIIYTQNQIKLREIAEAHRNKKIEIYNKFITISTNMLAGENQNIPAIKPYSEVDLVEAIFYFKKDLLLLGSPKVIKAILFFQETTINNPSNTLSSVDKLYQAMREDIGLSNKKLENNELIKIFLSDPKEIDKLEKK